MLCLIAIKKKKLKGVIPFPRPSLSSFTLTPLSHHTFLPPRIYLSPSLALKPLTPMSDQERISPCNINTISTR